MLTKAQETYIDVEMNKKSPLENYNSAWKLRALGQSWLPQQPVLAKILKVVCDDIFPKPVLRCTVKNLGDPNTNSQQDSGLIVHCDTKTAVGTPVTGAGVWVKEATELIHTTRACWILKLQWALPWLALVGGLDGPRRRRSWTCFDAPAF